MRQRIIWTVLLVALGAVSAVRAAETESKLPPGWLPVAHLDAATPWRDVGKLGDRIHLYLPEGDKPVRGIFVCYVFHSGDPREVVRLWRFALVAVPAPFEYDLGFHDRRNGRPKKTGLPKGDMSVLLRYLDGAAKETGRPELAVAPIVGWLGQNGAVMCNDLYQRAPDRVLAWADAWYGEWLKHPDLIAHVPAASAWEFSNERQRREEREKALPALADKFTPVPDLHCWATTYGFGHGIYSKWNFFMGFLDRCIAARLPAETPPAGQPTKLRPVVREQGWVADFNEIGQWVAIAPYAEAKGMVSPTWLPDAYAAWMYRSYHSAQPDLRITAPQMEYRRGGGKGYGLGYGNELAADAPLKFAAETTGSYAKIEFHDGDKIVGTAAAAPWEVEGVKLPHGLHALFAVGVTADGKRTASRPAFTVVQ